MTWGPGIEIINPILNQKGSGFLGTCWHGEDGSIQWVYCFATWGKEFVDQK